MLSIQKKLASPLKLDAKTTELIHTPHSYTLINHQSKSASTTKPDVCFYVVGCGGNGGETQKSVAELMNTTAEAGQQPKFIVILGDNFYDNGIDSPIDPAFNTHFYQIYHNKKLKALAGIPCFIIPGNHDHNIHRGIYGTRNGQIDLQKIAAQVLHTYIDAGGNIIPERAHLFKQQKLDLEKLPAWVMPSCYYSFDLEDCNIEFFMVDSNTYLRSYLQHLSGDSDNPHNQAAWLEHAAKKNINTIKFVFLHHPLHTIGKRVLKPDESLYLSDLEIAALQTLKITGNYNEMLRHVFKRQGLRFDAAFSAHDHSMYYYLEHDKDDELCQVIAGGGGGKLDPRYSVPFNDRVPCFFKNHGFVRVTVNPAALEDKIIFDFHTTDKHHLKFNQLSATPKKLTAAPLALDELVKLLINACRMYLKKHLGSSGNLTSLFKNLYESRRISPHGDLGIFRADDLINFLNTYEEISIKQIIDRLSESMAYWTTPSPDSLVTFISSAIEKRYGINYEKFITHAEFIVPPQTPTYLPVAARDSKMRFSPSEDAESYLFVSFKEKESAKPSSDLTSKPTDKEALAPKRSLSFT